MWFNYISYTLFSIINANCLSTFTSVTFNNATFKYPGQGKSERDLGICEQYSVCNIVHHRFWFQNEVERLCKCPNREECPWKWSSDNHTMPLNNRSQLKFCKPINELPKCTNQSGKSITIVKSVEDDKVQIKANVSCNCPYHTNWVLTYHEQITNETSNNIYVKDEFKCKKLEDCNAGEFCGHIRTDHYSTYTKCTCPYGHLCLHKDRQESTAYEMFLFYGNSYKAECTQFNTNTNEV